MSNPNPSPTTRFQKGHQPTNKGHKWDRKKRGYKEFLKLYLENGGAAADFVRARKKLPLPCVQEAADRVLGRAPQKIEASFDVRSVQVVHVEKSQEKQKDRRE